MTSVSTNDSVRELRRSKRFQLSAPAFFCWVDKNGKLHDRSGVTLNVSMGGAFIIANIGPHLGAPVSVDIYLPVNGNGKIVELHGEGKVARVEGSGESGLGFAAEVMFQTRASNEHTAGLAPIKAQ